MTAALTAEWVPTSVVARVLGRCEQRARVAMRERRVHAHHCSPGNRAGGWWMRADVLEAAAAGVDVDRQWALCGCAGHEWTPPPVVLGRARSPKRHP